MKLIETALPEVQLIVPEIFGDDRGWFFESHNQKEFEHLGISASFVQDNHSRSARHVLRGLHYQIQQPQGKLVRVIAGEVFDVAVDIRRSSPHFGQWAGFTLSAENRRMAWIPEGFAHGFIVLSDSAEFLYKTTNYWAPQYERCLLWNDPDIGIEWPVPGTPILSEKDRSGQSLKTAELYP